MNVVSALVGLCLVGQISASGAPSGSPKSGTTAPAASSSAVAPSVAAPNNGAVPNVVGPSAIGPEKPSPGKANLSPTTESPASDDEHIGPRRLRQPADTKTQPNEYEEPLPTPKGILTPKSNADASRDTNPPRNDSRRAADLIGAALTAPRSGALEGQSLTLTDAIARRTDRDGQVRLVHAYWKLASAVASYHGALDEYQRTLEAEEPRGREMPSAMAAVRSGAKARMYETQVVAVAAQFELLELMRSADNSAALPVPSDLPHVGLYATRFSEMYASRPAPSRVRQIHQTLPTLYDAVQSRAQSLAASTEAVDAAQAALRKGEIDIDTWINRLTQLNQHRQAFLAIVRAYNDDIADYALTVAGEGTPAADLAAMLIRVKATSASTHTAPINTARDPRLDGIRRGYIPPTGTAPFSTGAPHTNSTPATTVRPPATRDGFVPRGRSER